MGVKAPEPPEYSYTANLLIDAYNTIARSRRYSQSTPLTLGLSEIQAYCEQYELPVERHIFNAVIFELDNQFIDQSYKKIEAETKRK